MFNKNEKETFTEQIEYLIENQIKYESFTQQIEDYILKKLNLKQTEKKEYIKQIKYVHTV